MSRNKMDIINFSKIYDMFGEKAARDTLEDVNSGRVRESVIEKYLYTDETKEEYTLDFERNMQTLSEEALL